MDWYNDKPRRVHQEKRKKYKQRTTFTSESSKFNVGHGSGLHLDLADVCDIESSGRDY